MKNLTKQTISILSFILISNIWVINSQNYEQNSSGEVAKDNTKNSNGKYLGDRLTANQHITVNQGLRSPNGVYGLIMQTDGNLCVYKDGTEFVWCSMTNNNSKNTLVMQQDGNLVIYSQLNKPIWSTNTFSGGAFKQGKTLMMQDDGNLVLYNAYNNAVWSSR